MIGAEHTAMLSGSELSPSPPSEFRESCGNAYMLVFSAQWIALYKSYLARTAKLPCQGKGVLYFMSKYFRLMFNIIVYTKLLGLLKIF